MKYHAKPTLRLFQAGFDDIDQGVDKVGVLANRIESRKRHGLLRGDGFNLPGYVFARMASLAVEGVSGIRSLLGKR